jgi:hypothetical protein
MPINTLTCDSLSVLLWNANGLARHRDELDFYLHDRRIDIALIAETHFTSRTRFYIRDYIIYRTDHPDDRAHGGVAVIVKSHLNHAPCPSITHPHIQLSTIILKTVHKSIIIGSVYCPPRFRITKEMFTEFFSDQGQCFLIGGDFNAKHTHWGSRLCNPRGRNLIKAILENNMHVISPFSPTYWPTSPRKLPDLLDFYIEKGLSNVPRNIFTDVDLSSDHTSVCLTLWTEPKIESSPNLITGTMDWEKFRNNLDILLNIPVSMKTEHELEQAVEKFNSSIQQAAWSASSPRPQKLFPVYPNYIRNLIVDKRRARKRWHNTRLLNDKRIYNRLNNLLKTQLKIHREDKRDEQLSRLNSQDGSLWQKARSITQQPSIRVPIRKEGEAWKITNEDKSELFADHLENIFCPHDDLHDTSTTETVLTTLDTPLQLSLPPKPIKPSDVKNVILQLTKKKAPGYDLITAELLKELPRKGLVYLTSLFNSILRTTEFPLQWKYSQIRMILKPGKPPNSPSSYRPISLLPLCSKIFEKLLYKRILAAIPQGIIPNHQFGFRERHSTVHQLHRVVDFLASSLEKKMYAAGIFLDVSSAFDRVWHDGLLFKIKNILPHTYYLILKSFLSNRYFSVKEGTANSSIRQILAGVPQGAVLSPLLYSLYSSDFPLTDQTVTATFADDTTILAHDENSENVTLTLQHHMNLIHNWCNSWKVKLNTEKSRHVTFTLRRQTCPPVYFNNSPIPQTTSVKYLGLTLDRRLTWNPHTRLKKKTLNSRLKLIFTLLHPRSRLSVQQKLNCYTILIRPIWTYGSEIYGSAKSSNIHRIQTFQNKTLRLITGCPPYVRNTTLHNDLKIKTVHEFIHAQYTRFYSKLQGHVNPHIHSLSLPHLPHNPPRRLKRRWSRDLLRNTD